MKWRLCDCGTPMLSWCRLCARQTDRDIDRLLGNYDATGRELQPDQLPVGWTRPGEGALRADALPVPARVFDDITRLMASVSAEVQRTLTRYLMPELGPPYQHPHHVHDTPVMVFIGGPWDGHTEAPFAGNYFNDDDGDPDRTEPFTYQIIGGLRGARRRYALPAGINPTQWAADARRTAAQHDRRPRPAPPDAAATDLRSRLATRRDPMRVGRPRSGPGPAPPKRTDPPAAP